MGGTGSVRAWRGRTTSAGSAGSVAVVTADGDATHSRAVGAAGPGAGAVRCARRHAAWIERLDPATYLSSPYYARWLLAAEHGVVAKGVVTPDDLQRWYDVFAADPAATPPVVVDDEQASARRSGDDERRPAAAGDGAAVRRRRPRRRAPLARHRAPPPLPALRARRRRARRVGLRRRSRPRPGG